MLISERPLERQYSKRFSYAHSYSAINILYCDADLAGSRTNFHSPEHPIRAHIYRADSAHTRRQRHRRSIVFVSIKTDCDVLWRVIFIKKFHIFGDSWSRTSARRSAISTSLRDAHTFSQRLRWTQRNWDRFRLTGARAARNSCMSSTLHNQRETLHIIFIVYYISLLRVSPQLLHLSHALILCIFIFIVRP